jgi:hypothetical protein
MDYVSNVKSREINAVDQYILNNSINIYYQLKP